jgi:hypothetical protein
VASCNRQLDIAIAVMLVAGSATAPGTREPASRGISPADAARHIIKPKIATLKLVRGIDHLPKLTF